MNLRSGRGRRALALTAAPVLVAGVLTVATSIGGQASAADCPSFWVSPAGDDSGAGTKSSPWRSVEKARDQIRHDGLHKKMRCDITVNLAAGDYPVTKAITFDESDSGSNGHRVIYRSAGGPGAARFVGAEEITGWQPYQDGIFKAEVDPNEPFYTLFVNGDRATTARYPNRSSDDGWGPYLRSVLGEPEKEAVQNWLYWKAGEWDPAWDDTPKSVPLDDARITVWSGGPSSRVTDTTPIGGADYRKNFATFNEFSRYPFMTSEGGSRYFVENALVFLDQAGEYYADYDGGELYYKPAGGTMDGVTVMKPKVGTVFSFAGSSPSHRAHDIVLDGLTVTQTDFVDWYRNGWYSAGDSGEEHKYPQYDQRVEMPRDRFGAITLTNTSHIELTRMHLSQTGYHGIYLLFANDHVTVANSLLEHIGGDGIKIEGGYPGEGNIARDNTFTSNYIRHVGELVPGDAAGVEILSSGGNEISHSVIEHSASSGISLKTDPAVPVADNYSVGNRIHHVRMAELGLDSADTGAFYAYGVYDGGQPLPPNNTVSQITIKDVNADPSMTGVPPDGVRMDVGGCSFAFSDMEVTDVQGDQFRGGDTACNTFDNVSWEKFDSSRMEYDKIGVLPSFPYEVSGR